MRLTAALLNTASVLVLASCAAATTPASTAGDATPTPAAPSEAATTPLAVPGGTSASLPPVATSPPSPPTATDGGQIVEVALTDALRIEPAEIAVDPGRPVTFVVTNAGALDHEFFIGDAAAQAQREAQVNASDGVLPPAGPNGVSVAPGTTAELTFTFPAPGEWQGGCHILNHYAGGMKTTIRVT